MYKLNFHYTLTALVVTTLLSACGGNSTGSDSFSDNNLQGGNAVLSVDLVDAPVDMASNVFVNITGLELQGPQQRHSFIYCADNETQVATNKSDESTEEATNVDSESLESTEFDPDTNEAITENNDSMEEHSSEQPACSDPETRSVDLLALTGGAAERLLDGVVIPAGKYQWIRLQLAENPGTLVLDDGTEHELFIPSGNQTGLKLTGGFDAYNDVPNHLVLDFDLRKSVIKAGNKYLLKPTIKILRIDNNAEQSLTGIWPFSEAGDCPMPMAYLFEGADIVPDDNGGTLSQPTTSVQMTESEDGLGWAWTAPWLTPGEYTVAYTCDGMNDEPDVDDELEFREQFNATVNGS